MKRIETPNGMIVERNGDDYYYIHPAGLLNRINPDNLGILAEPQRTYVADAIKLLSND